MGFEKRPVVCLSVLLLVLTVVSPELMAYSGQHPDPGGSTPTYQDGIPSYQSNPDADAVLLLDFNGEVGPFEGYVESEFSPFTGFTAQDVRDVWENVAEFYSPFNLNVTTDERVFGITDENAKQRCIFTPTRPFGTGSASGVSKFGSFIEVNTPCLVFINPSNPRFSSRVSAHESGHTFGLSHDGTTQGVEYYGGHGSGEVSWSPIMGQHGQTMCQWSIGEYANANNTQDDIAQIAAYCGIAADVHAESLSDATYLAIADDGTVEDFGLIEDRNDVDGFRFTLLSSQTISLDITSGSNSNPSSDKPARMLDILVDLYDESGSLVVTDNPDLGLSASINQTLSAGTYRLTVDGVGRGAPLVDGYTDYSCLGHYKITGTIPDSDLPQRFSVDDISTNGTVVGTLFLPVDFPGGATPTFTITGGNTDNAFAIDSATGEITVDDGSKLSNGKRHHSLAAPTFDLVVDVTATGYQGSVRALITVDDINEAPVFTESAYNFYMTENTTFADRVIGTVTAHDPDRSDRIDYLLNSSIFEIDTALGVIRLQTGQNLPAGTHTLTVEARDYGTPQLTDTATVVIDVLNLPDGYQTGSVQRYRYDNLSDTSFDVSTLTSDSQYPDSPAAISTIDQLTNIGDYAGSQHFGNRVRGYILPPISGLYTFWTSASHCSEFYLSTDEDPANATLIATSPSGQANGHLGFDADSAQESVQIQLEAGKGYYFELLHKGYRKDEAFGVAWAGPGVPDREMISGAYLASYDDQTPIAIADAASLLFDSDNNGLEDVTLEGSDSFDPDGSISSYDWSEGATSLGTGVTLATTLSVGVHDITLTVTDNDGNRSNDTITVTVLVQGDTTPIAAPTGLAATVSDGLVDLDWNDNGETDLASYTVYRSTTRNSGYASIASGLSNSDYTDNGVVNGTRYYYVVTATDTAGNKSANSNEASGTPMATTITPGLLYGTVPGDIDTTTENPGTSVTTDLSETEDAIADHTTEIYTGEIYDADGNISFTEDIDDHVRLYIDGSLVLNDGTWNSRTSTGDLNLTAGWHEFELRIGNGAGGSGPHSSPGFGFDPAGGTNWSHPEDPGDGSLFRHSNGNATPPAAPTGLVAGVGDTTVVLSWDDNSDSDFDSYIVYRSTFRGTGYTSIATGLTSSSYTDNSVINGTMYYYVVTAIDTANKESADSTELSARPVDIPLTPVLTPIAVNASSWEPSRHPINTIDGMGMSWASPLDPATVASSTHYSQSNRFWHAFDEPAGDVWIEFDLGRETILETMVVWNYHCVQAYWASELGRGIEQFDLVLEDADHNLVAQFNNLTIQKALPQQNIPGEVVDFADTAGVRYVRIEVDSNYDNNNYAGLSEVRFTVTVTPNDLNGDGFVNMIDFSLFARNWLDQNCGDCNDADLDGDNNVDLDDLQILSGNWLAP